MVETTAPMSWTDLLRNRQVDLHPFMTRTDIVAMCEKHDIALEAWGPLVRGLRFKHPSITSLAKKYDKQPAQILLRYSIQKARVLTFRESGHLQQLT